MRGGWFVDDTAGTRRHECHKALNEVNSSSSSAAVQRLENAVKDINSKLDQVFLSASLRSPSGLYSAGCYFVGILFCIFLCMQP